MATIFHWASSDTNKLRIGIKLSDSTISDPNIPYRVFLFFGPDSSVSSDPAHYRSSSATVMAFNKGVDSTSITLTAPNLVNDGFLEGQTMFIAAYTANAGSINSSYADPATGRNVFVNINPVRSNVIKVVIP